MTSTEDYANWVLEQAALAGEARIRKMFGEYALYLDDKVVALICDDSVFMKDLPAVRALFEELELSIEEGPPYPGAKTHILGGELVENPSDFARALQLTASLLPKPKTKKAAKPKTAPKPRKKKA